MKIDLKKMADKKTAIRIVMKYWYVLPLIIIFIFGFWIRSFPVKYGELTGLDEFYIYRASEYLVQHNLQQPDIDVMRNYPLGFKPSIGEYPGPTYIPAIMYLAASAIGIKMHFLTFALIFPAFMGALAAALMFFVGKALQDNKTGLLAAFFLSVTPAFITRTAGGGIEKEAAVAPFMILSMWMFIASYKKKSWLYGILSGIFLLISGQVWGGIQYFYVLYSFFVLILLLLGKDTDHLLKMFAPLAIIGVVIPLAFTYHLPYFNPTVVVTEFVLAMVIIKYALARFALVKKEQLKYVVPVILVLGLVGIGVASLFVEGLEDTFDRVNTLLTGKQASAIAFTVAENQPGSMNAIAQNIGFGFSQGLLPWLAPIGQYFTLWVFMMLGMLIAAYHLLKTKDPLYLYLVIWVVTSIWGVLFQIRLMFLLAPVAALLGGYSISAIINSTKRLKIMQNAVTLKQKANYVAQGLVLLVAIVVVINAAEGYAFSNGITPIICFVQQNPPTQCITIDGNGDYQYAPNQPWYESLGYLATKTPEDSNIISWWDFGYWFQTRGLRNTVADGGYGPRPELAWWFTADYTNWSMFEPEWRDKYGVDYIFMDYTLPGKYGAISAIASAGKNIQGFLQFSAQPSGGTERRGVTINNATYNVTDVEFSGNPYNLVLTVQTGTTNILEMRLYDPNQPAAKAFINEVCTNAGIARVSNREQSPGGCIALRPIGVFYLPDEVKNTIFSRLMFMEGAGLPVEKVFDNQLMQIYKINWEQPEQLTSGLPSQ
ncbi:MAG: hypothetical protein HY518_00820 [Candidatus Aenigmarchaeota archaeon]|nr:hypothetical protein [Candidatus Aenigmarchaeota archaeon]